MKIISLFIFLWLFLLTSCSGGTETTDETGLVIKGTDIFSIKLPETWKEVTWESLPLPKNGQVEFAYASPQERQGYLNNIVILSSKNALSESSTQLMWHNAKLLNESLQDFTIIEEKKQEFLDGEEGIFLSFYGKYNTITPELTYIQTAKSCGDMSYFITVSLAEKLETYEKYEYLLQSFECK